MYNVSHWHSLGRRWLLLYSQCQGYHSNGTAFSPYSVTLASVLGDCAVEAVGASGALVHTLANALDAESEIDVAGQEYSGLRALLRRRTTAGLQQYSAALIMGGTNDLAAMWEAREIAENLRTLHELCWSHGLRTIALSVPPNMGTASTSSVLAYVKYRQTYASLNTLIEEMAAGSDDRCLFIDTSELVPWGAAGCCECVANISCAALHACTSQSLNHSAAAGEPDGLHFSPAGSAKLGHGLGESAAVKKFLFAEGQVSTSEKAAARSKADDA